MSTLILLLIVGGCVAYQYFKGSLTNAAVSIITVLCSGILAFAYFEKAAAFLAAQFGDGGISTLSTWLNTICYILIFVVAFAILQTVASKLILKSIEFDFLVNRVGSCLCAAIYGWLFTGVLLTALVIAPLPKNYPYSRIKSASPLIISKSFLFPDDAISGLFATISRGSMKGPRSFSVIHPSLINESFLNRLALSRTITFMAAGSSVRIVSEKAVQPAPENLKDVEGNLVVPANDSSLIIVKIEVQSQARDFLLSQVRLICNEKVNSGLPMQGKGINVYPIGHMVSADKIDKKRLGDTMKMTTPEKVFQLVYEVPNDYSPLFLGFKQNNLMRLPKINTPSEDQSGESN